MIVLLLFVYAMTVWLLPLLVGVLVFWSLGLLCAWAIKHENSDAFTRMFGK